MRVFLVLVFFSLASCATNPQKEYEWIDSSNEVVSIEILNSVKKECDYDNKVNQGKKKMRTAFSVGRYETNGNRKRSNSIANEAKALFNEAKKCMLEKGYSSREK